MKPTGKLPRLDNLKRAHKKNVVEKSHLQNELKSLDREKLIQMRLDKYERQQFKNKYGAMMYDALDENKGREPSDVVMYETHCPGFCYRRNGECRSQPATIINSSVNMQDLHIMLFTKGEIDVEKVVCLYLLTAHLCDTLRMPPNSQRATFLTRQHSPLERLIDRSKRRYAENKLRRYMPLYTLDVSDSGQIPKQVMDPRLTGRVIVNTKIIQIIDSVRNALHKSNSTLFSKIVEIGCDVEKIKEMMRKPKMLKFYSALHGQNIISSCESFQLEIIHSEIIPIHVDVEQFGNLIKVIRSNVLLIPNSDTWKSAKAAIDPYVEDELDECDKNELTNICKEVDEPSVAPKVEESESDEPDLECCNSCVKMTNTDFVLDIEIEEGGNRTTDTLPQQQPKILKNFKLGFSEIGIGTESLNENRIFVRIDESTTFHELATLLTKKVRQESRVEHRESTTDLDQPTEVEVLEAQLSQEIEQLICSSSTHQHAGKQMTCYACMQRWASPRPVPKISKILKGVVPQLKDTSYFSSRSAQYISAVIDERIRKFQEFDDSRGKVVISNRMVKKMAKGSLLADTSIEIVNLDELELAKIRQEIKEIETRKKLQKYLDRSDLTKKGKLKHKRMH